MARLRYVPRPTAPIAGTPFESAEEAWLWMVRALQYDDPGAHLTAGYSRQQRPCEPRDVKGLVLNLVKQRKISGPEFDVLCRYGLAFRPPDDRDPEERSDCMLWRSGLNRLDGPLRKKGIVCSKLSDGASAYAKGGR